MSSRTQIIDRWTSDLGLTSELHEVTRQPGELVLDAVASAMRHEECGAWHGRTGCRNPAAYLAIGGVGLCIMTHRRIIRAGRSTFAYLCHRHAGPLEQITRDMPRPLRRAEERALAKLLAKAGASHLVEEARIVVLTPLAAAS
jgi:hypothetical protein